MLSDSREFFDRYIGSLERLEELTHLYQLTTDLEDSEPLELNLTTSGSIEELMDDNAVKQNVKANTFVGRPHKAGSVTSEEDPMCQPASIQHLHEIT